MRLVIRYLLAGGRCRREQNCCSRRRWSGDNRWCSVRRRNGGVRSLAADCDPGNNQRDSGTFLGDPNQGAWKLGPKV